MNSNQVEDFRTLLRDAIRRADSVGDVGMSNALAKASSALWDLGEILDRNEKAAGPLPIADDTDDEAGN